MKKALVNVFLALSLFFVFATAGYTVLFMIQLIRNHERVCSQVMTNACLFGAERICIDFPSPCSVPPLWRTRRDTPNYSMCNPLFNNVENRLEALNHCITDSDCAIETFKHPFYHRLVNKSENLTRVKAAVQEYFAQCISGPTPLPLMYPMPPRVEDIKCIDSKCVTE